MRCLALFVAALVALLGRAPAGDDKGKAGFRQLACNAQTDATSAAGDQRHPIFIGMICSEERVIARVDKPGDQQAKLQKMVVAPHAGFAMGFSSQGECSPIR